MASGASRVPPGFRFHPTDEELVNYYLRKKVNFEKFDLDVIRDVDLNKLEPWDLQERCRIDTAQQTEWYFFSHKDKKYPTGTRTNRATSAGFWKATGRDKAVHATCSALSHQHHHHHHHNHHHQSCTILKRIGMRKTLVFYRGRAPHGQKTDWIMHEYRLEDAGPTADYSLSNNEDGWVVCRVFKKRIHHQKPAQATSQAAVQASEEEQSSLVENINHDDIHYKNSQVKNSALTAASSCLKLSCKREEDYEDNLPQVPFLHMPQLDSPNDTTNENILFSDPLDYQGRRCLMNGEPSCYKSLFAHLEMPTLEMTNYTKPLNIFADSVVDVYGQENDQWGVLESLPKDMRYDHLPSDSICANLLSTNCDMDIWKPLL